VAKGAKAIMGELQLRDALAAAFGDSPFDTSRVAHAAENSGATCCRHRGACAGRYRLKPIVRILKRAWRGFNMWISRLLGDQLAGQTMVGESVTTATKAYFPP
jgi:hypothetical protein